jgi:ABC-type transporter Mla subunit MlaD
MQAPQLRRGPFGYTSRSVRLVLADRDRVLVKASERAGAAEAQMLERRSEAETLKTQLADQDEPLRAAEERSGEIAFILQELSLARWHLLIQGQQVESAEARIEVLEADVRSLRPELEAGLSTAVADLEAARAAGEEAAARPAPDPSVTAEGTSAVPEAAGWTTARMNGAGTHAAEELGEAERARRETLAEIERLAAFRDRLASLVGVVRSTTEDAREGAAGIGDRVDEAVAPLTEAIAELSDRLAGFAELAVLAGEDTREPASEGSLNPIELEDLDGALGQPDPAGEVGPSTSHDPRTEEAQEPAAEGIVPAAGPPAVDQTSG